MKLINKYLILLCVFVCFSCNYLDIVPDENPTEEDAFKNPQLTERYLYSCYAYIPNPRHATAILQAMMLLLLGSMKLLENLHKVIILQVILILITGMIYLRGFGNVIC